jgi:hypothetical protein
VLIFYASNSLIEIGFFATVATELLRTIQQLTSSFTSNAESFPKAHGNAVTEQRAAGTFPSLPISSAPNTDSVKPAIPQSAPPPQQQVASTPKPVVPKEPTKPAFSFTVASTEKHMEELVNAMQDKQKHQIVLQMLHASLKEFPEKAFQLFFDAFLG